MTPHLKLPAHPVARTFGVLVAILTLMLPAPGTAQEPETTSAQPGEAEEAAELAASSSSAASPDLLFDRFSFKLSGQFASEDTTVKVDGPAGLFPGTEIDFESDLGVDDFSLFGDFRLELLLGRRHRLSFLYDRNDRTGTRTIATEIRFDDIVFPVNAEIDSEFNSQNLGVGYTYFFKRGERTAIGASLALAIGDRESRLTGMGFDELDRVLLSVDSRTRFPQPQLGLELRQMVGEKWRLIASVAGISLNLDVDTTGKFDGSLLNAGVSIEHLTFRYASFGFGLAANYLDAVLEDGAERQEVRTTNAGGELFVRFRVPTP